MDTRKKFNVKLGQAGNIQFVFTNPETHPRDASEFTQALLTPDYKSQYFMNHPDRTGIEVTKGASIVRLHPEVYDSFLPGVKKPNAIFKTGKNEFEQIHFDSFDAAAKYAEQMGRMNIKVIKERNKDVPWIEQNDGLFVIRTDAEGKKKLTASYIYFQDLLTSNDLKIEEANFKRLLDDFKRECLFACNLHEQKFATLDEIRKTLNKPLTSKEKILEIIDLVNANYGFSDKDFVDSSLSFFKSIGRCDDSTNFSASVRNFNLIAKAQTAFLSFSNEQNAYRR